MTQWLQKWELRAATRAGPRHGTCHLEDFVLLNFQTNKKMAAHRPPVLVQICVAAYAYWERKDKEDLQKAAALRETRLLDTVRPVRKDLQRALDNFEIQASQVIAPPTTQSQRARGKPPVAKRQTPPGTSRGVSHRGAAAAPVDENENAISAPPPESGQRCAKNNSLSQTRQSPDGQANSCEDDRAQSLTDKNNAEHPAVEDAVYPVGKIPIFDETELQDDVQLTKDIFSICANDNEGDGGSSMTILQYKDRWKFLRSVGEKLAKQKTASGLSVDALKNRAEVAALLLKKLKRWHSDKHMAFGDKIVSRAVFDETIKPFALAEAMYRLALKRSRLNAEQSGSLD
eukprot:g6461.t1